MIFLLRKIRQNKWTVTCVLGTMLQVVLFVVTCTTTPPPAEKNAQGSKTDDNRSDDKAEEKVEKALSKSDQEKLDELRAEMELGRNMAGRLLGFYGMVEQEDLTKYLNVVGRYVGSYSDAPDRRYMFAVLDAEMVNAFACPGGYVLITKGALRLAKSESELAMVLGHEVAHVGKQHMFNTLKTMSKEEMDKAAEEADKKLALPESVRARARPKPEDSALGAILAKYLSGGSGSGFSILKAATAGMSVILEKGLDHKFEFEADQEGVKYAIRAGYDPRSLGSYLKRIDDGIPKEKQKMLSTTHPKIAERVKRIEELLKKLEAEQIVGAKGKKRFEKYLKLIPAEKKV